MSKRSNAVPGGGRRRAMASVGVLGLLMFSVGLSLAVQGGSTAASGGVPVLVCHATGSDSNPYVIIFPDSNSTNLHGHQMHRDHPNKTWKSAGWWNGMHHNAGDPKRDYIHSYTDGNGVFHQEDGNITAADCLNTSPPTPTPTPTPTSTSASPSTSASSTSASVSPSSSASSITPTPTPTVGTTVDPIPPAFENPSCSPKRGSEINLAGLGFLTAADIAATSNKVGFAGVYYTVSGSVASAGTATVTATAIDPVNHPITVGDTTVWTHTFTALTKPCTKPVVVTPTPSAHSSVVIPTAVHSGLVSVTPASGSGSATMRALGLGLAGVGSVLMLGAMGLVRRTAKR